MGHATFTNNRWKRRKKVFSSASPVTSRTLHWWDWEFTRKSFICWHQRHGPVTCAENFSKWSLTSRNTFRNSTSKNISAKFVITKLRTRKHWKPTKKSTKREKSVQSVTKWLWALQIIRKLTISWNASVSSVELFWETLQSWKFISRSCTKTEKPTRRNALLATKNSFTLTHWSCKCKH